MIHLTKIVTPPISTAFTTLVAAQEELSEYGSDARLTKLINQASRMIVGYTGREFARARVSETFVSDFQLTTNFRVEPKYFLSRAPIFSLVSMSEDGRDSDMASIDWDADTAVVYRWGFGHRTVIVYDGGYALPNDPDCNLPDDVERACIDIVAALWFRSGEGSRDPMIRSETIDGIGSTSYLDPAKGSAGAIPPNVAASLTSYMNTRVD